MTLEEKLKIFIDKGWTCNPDTGEVWSHTGRLSFTKSKGYLRCSIRYNKIGIKVQAHQLVWFLSTGRVPKIIDHINGIRNDNRLINLRDVETSQKNHFNITKARGYCWNKNKNKFQANIRLNNKGIHLGLFNSEQEARQAYLDAKKIYHII